MGCPADPGCTVGMSPQSHASVKRPLHVCNVPVLQSKAHDLHYADLAATAAV